MTAAPRVTAAGSNPLLTEANPALGERLSPPMHRLAPDPVPPEVAYQLIHDELLLDGSARLNLATFVTTWMEPQALQRRWASRVDDRTRRPNLVMGANVQVCWEKFCRYWDVEPRIVPMSGDRFHLDAEQAVAHCDQDTIGVVAILGSTFDGSNEPVADIAAALNTLAAAGGPDVPIHVDGASGAMIAPFLDPELVWDFQLPRVVSINTSGHKYGLVYPGVGWVLWRDADALPQELIFNVNYLGGDMPTFALNFSRPGSQVVAQYYTFFQLGRSGFVAVQQAARDVATFLSRRIGAMPEFRLLSRGDELPVFAFTTTDQAHGWDVFAVSRALRLRGWQLPAYTFPADREDLAVLRIVCRNGFGHDLADLFLKDLDSAVAELRTDSTASVGGTSGFHH